MPCQGPRDAVVLSVYGGVDLGGAICDGSGEVDERFLVGEKELDLLFSAGAFFCRFCQIFIYLPRLHTIG